MVITIKPKVIEPFPYVPNEPGIYYACLPQGTQTINLQFNEQNTFSMTITVPAKGIQIPEPFIGGVFRKYGTGNAIGKIINSKRVLDSGEGDLKTTINPTGTGAYFTNLSVASTNTSDIAEALRLYQPGTFVDFGLPGENFHAILIGKFGEQVSSLGQRRQLSESKTIKRKI